MTDARMLIIVPTRSRPENVAKVVRAWEDTDAFRHADLCFAHDNDDPAKGGYLQAFAEMDVPAHGARFMSMPKWLPLVPKLNGAASTYAEYFGYFAIGFAGDDHLPRTHGWAARYLEKLIEMGTGVVSCPDGYRGDRLPTQWAMTADIVHALGRMVPAPVEHLYCDNAVWDLAEAAGCYAYLEDVLIEHMHPLAGRSEWDAQYRNVNRPAQYRRDQAAYRQWRNDPGYGLSAQALAVRELREERAAATAPNPSGGAS